MKILFGHGSTAVLVVLALASIPATAEVYVALHLGASDYLGDADVSTASVVGIQVAGGQSVSHMGGEFCYWRSTTDGTFEGDDDEDVDSDLAVTEIAFGIGYYAEGSGVRPWYVGGGLSVIRAEADNDKADLDDTTLGAYVTGSIRRRAGENVSFGLAGRLMLFTDVGGVDLNTLQVTVFAAFGK